MFERIFPVRFKCQNTTIIQVFATTNEAEEEVKEDYYHQLHTAFNKRKTRNLIVIISLINAEISSNNRKWEPRTGSGQWEMWNVLCIKWTCNQANTLPTQEISQAHMEISWRDLGEPDWPCAYSKTWKSWLEDSNLKCSANICIRVGHFTRAEVKRQLKAVKNGKDAGCDNIPRGLEGGKTGFIQGSPFPPK